MGMSHIGWCPTLNHPILHVLQGPSGPQKSYLPWLARLDALSEATRVGWLGDVPAWTMHLNQGACHPVAGSWSRIQNPIPGAARSPVSTFYKIWCPNIVHGLIFVNKLVTRLHEGVTLLCTHGIPPLKTIFILFVWEAVGANSSTESPRSLWFGDLLCLGILSLASAPHVNPSFSYAVALRCPVSWRHVRCLGDHNRTGPAINFQGAQSALGRVSQAIQGPKSRL